MLISAVILEINLWASRTALGTRLMLGGRGVVLGLRRLASRIDRSTLASMSNRVGSTKQNTTGTRGRARLAVTTEGEGPVTLCIGILARLSFGQLLKLYRPGFIVCILLFRARWALLVLAVMSSIVLDEIVGLDRGLRAGTLLFGEQEGRKRSVALLTLAHKQMIKPSIAILITSDFLMTGALIPLFMAKPRQEQWVYV